MKLAVTGGKGGTGKSVVAVNLAVALARNHKVTLVDADVDCPDDHLLMDTELENEREVSSFVPSFSMEKCTGCGKCAGSCHVHAIYIIKGKPNFFDKICTGCRVCENVCPEGAIRRGEKIVGHTYETEKYGVRLVTGALKPSEPISAKVVAAVKKRAGERESEVFVIDTAAGTHCTVVEALEGADRALVVTEPTPFGTHDMERIVGVLEKIGVPYDLLVNRSDISDLKISGNILEIPYDRKLIESYALGEPLVVKYPEYSLSQRFYELGEKICKG